MKKLNDTTKKMIENLKSRGSARAAEPPSSFLNAIPINDANTGCNFSGVAETGKKYFIELGGF